MRTLHAWPFTVLSVALLAAGVRAGGARIVDPALGNPSYADPISAILAAPEGAVILVAQGTYPGFAISGKSVSIFAMPNSVVSVGTVDVSGLTGSQTVVLSGLSVFGPVQPDIPAIRVANCAGSVRLEACTFAAYDRDFGYCMFPGDSILAGGPAAVVESSTRVLFRACTLTGGRGETVIEADDPPCSCGIPHGGDALKVTGATSRVVLHGCKLRGGAGGSAPHCAGDGGDGLRLAGGSAFLADCLTFGGAGGMNTGGGACGGRGGDGAATAAAGALRVLDSTSFGASGGVPCGSSGLAYAGPSHVAVPGFAAQATFTPVVISDTLPLGIAFQGGGGEDVAAVYAPRVPRILAFGPRGPILVQGDPYLPIFELGTADGAGALSAQLQMPNLPAGSGSSRPVVQILSLGAFGWTPGAAATLLVLDRESAPDCNGNGLNDFVELLQNPSLDANKNLIPDACPGG
jgi:hypothetical protein